MWMWECDVREKIELKKNKRWGREREPEDVMWERENWIKKIPKYV